MFTVYCFHAPQRGSLLAIINSSSGAAVVHRGLQPRWPNEAVPTHPRTSSSSTHCKRDWGQANRPVAVPPNHCSHATLKPHQLYANSDQILTHGDHWT